MDTRGTKIGTVWFAALTVGTLALAFAGPTAQAVEKCAADIEPGEPTGEVGCVFVGYENCVAAVQPYDLGSGWNRTIGVVCDTDLPDQDVPETEGLSTDYEFRAD